MSDDTNDSSIAFKYCTPDLVNKAVPLIYSSGPSAFNYVFCHSDENQSTLFLANAFSVGHSEFNCTQHLGCFKDNELVGVAALKTSDQNLFHTWQALKSILRNYSMLEALKTIIKGLTIETILPPPTKGVGIIYHVGVNPSQQGKGYGQMLMEHLEQKARSKKIKYLELDVAETNSRAEALYSRLGYVVLKCRKKELKTKFGEVVGHKRMRKVL